MDNIGSQLVDAATLMVTGMVVVFTFLTILVFLVRLMSRLVPEEAPMTISSPTPKHNVTNTSAVNPKVIAAISAAVHQHRQSK